MSSENNIDTKNIKRAMKKFLDSLISFINNELDSDLREHLGINVNKENTKIISRKVYRSNFEILNHDEYFSSLENLNKNVYGFGEGDRLDDELIVDILVGGNEYFLGLRSHFDFYFDDTSGTIDIKKMNIQRSQLLDLFVDAMVHNGRNRDDFSSLQNSFYNSEMYEGIAGGLPEEAIGAGGEVYLGDGMSIFPGGSIGESTI